MKKEKPIVIVFGGRKETYLNKVGFFKEFEKHFNCKIKKKSNFVYHTNFCINTKKHSIFFLFAFGPKNEWKRHHKYFKEKRKIIIPPSIEKVCDYIKRNYKTQIVLLFGLCGAFKGTPNTIYLPISTSKLYFGPTIIFPEEIGKKLPSAKINFSNILTGKIKGKRGQVISTNKLLQNLGAVNSKDWIYLWRNYISKKDPDRKYNHDETVKWTTKKSLQYYKVLKKFGHIIDMESYTIAKRFGKIKLGIMLQVVDVLSKDVPLTPELKFDEHIFVKQAIKAIKKHLPLK